jgi:acetate kinase
MKYLIVNTGSTSKKYAFYSNEEQLLFAHLEHEDGSYVVSLNIKDKVGKIKINDAEFHDPHKHIIDLLKANNIIDSKSDIDAVGIRVVAPGAYFLSHSRIDERYIKKLADAKDIAPIHIESVLTEVKQLQAIFPEVKLIAVSDSYFHKKRPDAARYYAISKNITDKLELYRYGYHGISVQSILHKLQKKEVIHSKIIICHLGGGSSITAVKNGVCMDTSMGFSPLEGLVMATRVGDIDPGAVLYLAKKLNYTEDQMEQFLNHHSGLLGISGKTSDVRELIKLEKDNDPNARLALDMMVYRIKKYIGSYIAAMNGVDLIVFSGTIGERSNIIRERVCRDLDGLGIHLDKEKNNNHIDIEGNIHSAHTKVHIEIVKTDEMAEIARQTKNLLKSK